MFNNYVLILSSILAHALCYGMDPHAQFLQAIQQADTRKIEQLIGSGIDDVNSAYNIYKETYLHVAAQSGFINVACILLKAGAQVNAVSDCLGTPLHYAISQDNLAMVEFLLDSGADCEVVNQEGLTALDMALKYNYLKIAECLLSYGAKQHNFKLSKQEALLLITAHSRQKLINQAVATANFKTITEFLKQGVYVNRTVKAFIACQAELSLT